MSEFKKKLENFWYHYKWHTIIGSATLLFLIYMVVQCAGVSSYSLSVLYVGPEQPDLELKTGADELFTSMWQSQNPQDEGGEAQLASIFLLNEAQREAQEITPPLASLLHDNEQQFWLNFSNGDCLIYLMDPAWYQEAKKKGVFLTWEQTVGEAPQGAMDEYAIRFWDTPFAQSYAGTFADIPADTVLCMRKLPDLNFFVGKKEQERFAAQIAFFTSIVKFGEN